VQLDPVLYSSDPAIYVARSLLYQEKQELAPMHGSKSYEIKKRFFMKKRPTGTYNGRAARRLRMEVLQNPPWLATVNEERERSRRVVR
jgi:hypothetical protein